MYALALVMMVMGAWAYMRMKPPPPKVCNSPGGPTVTSPRVRLRDGRYLAFKEKGVPKEKAKFKVIVVHGFDSSKDIYLPLSQELMEEFGIYIVTFDRAGYGESDPNPKRSVKSEAFVIEELADKLQLGPKFYVVGVSLGNYAAWACLKYIPHRLGGVALVVPVINYWWPSFPAKLVEGAYMKQLGRDQWKLRIAHHAPGLMHWWMTQNWFPSCTIMERNPIIFNQRDFRILADISKIPMPNEHKIRQQGEQESLYRDLIVGFGNWEFDPMELKDPFTHNNGSVHLWQGYEDTLVPFELQRYISQKLPWIRYHEVRDGGHLIIHDASICEAIFRSLLVGEKPLII